MHWIEDSSRENVAAGRALALQADAIGDAPFLASGDRRYSYGEANETVNRYANSLRALGVEAGDPVAMLMDNSLEFVFTALGTNKLGAMWVPTNTSYRGEWLARTFVDGGAKVLVVDESLLDRATDNGLARRFERVVVNGDPAAIADEAVRQRAVALADFAEGAGTEVTSSADAATISSVMWTSGTTGRSKGVMQPYGAWYAAARIFASARDLAPGDVLYCCVPLFNSGGWSLNVFQALYSGLSIAIDREFSVSRFWDRVRRYGATQLLTLGSMHMYLWQREERDDDADNPARVAGLLPLPAEIREAFQKRFGLERIWRGYGQSEIMPLSVSTPEREGNPAGDGFPRPDVEVALLDERGREVPVGEVGEICVRPRRPDVMFRGYYNNEEGTAKAWRDGWYHSNDLGRFDEAGELYFVDRASDYMRHKGRNIPSLELEELIGRHPAVYEVAAHGVPSQDLAEEDEVKICVILREGYELEPEELIRFINERAPYFMVPRYVEFVTELPHTPTGRVQKFKLRERGVTPDTWDREAAGLVLER
ncbi:AMP-binding protein [Mycolicibacterium thermoresistibile]